MRGEKMMRKRTITHESTWTLIPVISVLCLLPLIVRAKVLTYDTSMLNWYVEDITYIADMFTYYKAAILIATAFLMLIYILWQAIYKKRNYNHKLFMPVYIYLIVVILSTFFSIAPNYSITGYISRMENVFVLMAYMVVFYYTANLKLNAKLIGKITTGWVISIFLLTLIGLTQFFGFDLYRSDLGINLVVPTSLIDSINSVEFTLWENNLIYQSLSHYNYVSFYSAVAFPYFLALLIGSDSTKKRLLYVGLLTIIIFNLLGSQGRNGIVGLVLGSLVVLLLFGRNVFLSRKVIIPIVTSVSILIILIITTDTTFEKRIVETFTSLKLQTDYPLNDISIIDNEIVIDHDDFNITIGALDEQSGAFTFRDENNDKLDINQNNGILKIVPNSTSHNQYNAIALRAMIYENDDVLSINLSDTDWNFIYSNNVFTYLNPYGIEENLVPADAVGFDGNERWGSKRGYIWSRTLPLITKSPLLGYGPSTYPIAFPQNDYVGKVNAYRNVYTVVDKPHNILLNYAVNTGVLSLLAIIAIIVIAMYNSVRTIKNESLHTDMKMYIIASTGSITGYVASGMFNDTSLYVTPIFWILIGLNYAIWRTE